MGGPRLCRGYFCPLPRASGRQNPQLLDAARQLQKRLSQFGLALPYFSMPLQFLVLFCTAALAVSRIPSGE